MLGRLRARYEATMQPIGRKLGKIGVTPNAISTLSLLIAVLAAIAYASRAPVLGAVSFLVSGFVDMLDGAVARATGAVTRFGAVYDPVLDRYAEFAVLFGMGFGGLVSWVWVIFSLFGMVMASYVRARAESAGGLESCSVGIAERQEKIILLVIGSLVQPFFNLGLSISVVIVGILSHVTAAQRLRFTWNQTSERNANV